MAAMTATTHAMNNQYRGLVVGGNPFKYQDRVEISSPEAHAGATFLQTRAVAALDDEGSTDDDGEI